MKKDVRTIYKLLQMKKMYTFDFRCGRERTDVRPRASTMISVDAQLKSVKICWCAVKKREKSTRIPRDTRLVRASSAKNSRKD